MNLMLGFFFFVCLISSACVTNARDLPVDVLNSFFEYSREQKYDEASQLWGKSKDTEIKVINKSGENNFRMDLSYSKEIFDLQYKIVDYKEFRKTEDKTVLCLSIVDKNKRELMFRSDLELIENKWKITSLKDAREDAMAVINNDCITLK